MARGSAEYFVSIFYVTNFYLPKQILQSNIQQKQYVALLLNN